ncbi:hypothetical protein ACH5RR_015695 [Cinchona calisaya]|uniref:Uncharacterized protein n=1 Tax=Cinchona calisaya TaxID=153742 RepID=A0ABD2ZTX3_9GENT
MSDQTPEIAIDDSAGWQVSTIAAATRELDTSCLAAARQKGKNTTTNVDKEAIAAASQRKKDAAAVPTTTNAAAVPFFHHSTASATENKKHMDDIEAENQHFAAAGMGKINPATARVKGLDAAAERAATSVAKITEISDIADTILQRKEAIATVKQPQNTITDIDSVVAP